ncbi:Trihelix transcription factor ASIL2 [Dichanthelium oligosanthes]|uniref:Trihelix transcription factor ASIL2 n=1 Tax=Dichanthelium oligosanthes TaxID=888268 RepID=A0A1E5VT63_9POAL|nr:Trihelix transcription factor ASIL2 [Dichanthelium oligosanthes]
MDDDGAASLSPSPSPSRSPSPLPVADPVTVAAAPPGHVAVAIPLRKPSPSSGGGGGGGREDAWSDGATSTLIDAWGERFVALGRGSLRHPQWQEVAEVVSSRDGYSKPPKSDVQCKNRIDTLKKKYKIEKAKRGSSWPYFDRLDDLLAPVLKPNSSSSSAAAAAARNAVPIVPPRINFPQRTRTPLQPSAGNKRRMPSPPPQASASSDSSDGFPPEAPSALPNGKRQRLEEPAPAAAANGAESSDSRVQGLRDLALAIRRLGEVYERVESVKREQELRMERERLDAARELEDQRVQFFLKMQAELSKATGAATAAAPMAVPIPADGNGTRRSGMAAEVATSSNHRVRYRFKGSSHRHAEQQPHYQNNAASGGNGSDSDNKEAEAEEDAEDEEEESQ